VGYRGGMIDQFLYFAVTAVTFYLILYCAFSPSILDKFTNGKGRR
jgi:hypothetical protein